MEVFGCDGVMVDWRLFERLACMQEWIESLDSAGWLRLVLACAPHLGQDWLEQVALPGVRCGRIGVSGMPDTVYDLPIWLAGLPVPVDPGLACDMALGLACTPVWDRHEDEILALARM